jgi:chromate reductase, NAD(P)H dehydrogenase (quinone)
LATPVHVLGISGSLRRASFNSAALRVAKELLPPDMTLHIEDIAPIPFYNGDVEAAGVPASVREFTDRVRAADALLISTPEYNYSVPGVLKNALDWASRPPRDMATSGKPLAIMGAGGRYGTVRAQMHLRQIAPELNMFPLNKPQVHIQRPWEKFDRDGNLTDEPTRLEIQALLVALGDWARRLRGE